MKKKLLVLATLTLLATGVASGTLAYYTAEERVHNVITTGEVDIALVETTNQVDAEGKPIPFEDVSGVMPGMTVSKIVQVENTGGAAAYVRVKVEKAIEMADGAVKPDLDLIVIDFNTGAADNCWTEKDGYYYYNAPLDEGEITEPLFTSVMFDETMGNAYQKCLAKVDVSAYATQVANNGSKATEAKGWPKQSEK